MNILIISRGIPTEKYPLAGIFETDQARALSAYGHSITLFAIDLRSIRHRRRLGIVKHHIDSKIEAYSISVPVGRVPFNIQYAIGRFALSILYKKIYKNKPAPDIIHAHFTDMAYIAMPLAQKLNTHFVVTEHSSIMNQDTVSEKTKKIAAAAYKAADRVIAVSRGLQKNIEKHTGIHAEIVHNIVDTALFSQCKPVKHTGFHFVTVCNLIKSKRVDLVIQAMSALHKVHNDISLTVIGDGQQNKDLKNLVHQLQGEDFITFTGKIDRTAICACFQNMDCFVLPSQSETFGVAYIEAMSAGLPVIATKCGGPEDFVNEGNGLLIDCDNPGLLTEAMETMYLKAEQRYDKEKIKNYAADMFSPEAISRVLTQFYSQIVTGGGKH